MNFDALLVIGTFTLVLGLILFLPLIIWKKWKGDNAFPATGTLSVKINSRGIRFSGIVVIFLLVGFVQEYMAPHSYFGGFVSHWYGKLIYLICVGFVASIIEYAFALYGVKFTEQDEDDV